ncbi:hypothetical protein Micbo1qcDRAFT_223011 [Microdochium bolleyi]|uniref:Uncharacterized protein n=1 Tax=Microdochium bolleyi TaxID=196109 RepID=A0A136J8K7_9PEZI|nr:hypothetical protein Micbo1qcDRAFT_223011 [Microdochium bolleyi]
MSSDSNKPGPSRKPTPTKLEADSSAGRLFGPLRNLRDGRSPSTQHSARASPSQRANGRPLNTTTTSTTPQPTRSRSSSSSGHHREHMEEDKQRLGQRQSNRDPDAAYVRPADDAEDNREYNDYQVGKEMVFRTPTTREAAGDLDSDDEPLIRSSAARKKRAREWEQREQLGAETPSKMPRLAVAVGTAARRPHQLNGAADRSRLSPSSRATQDLTTNAEEEPISCTGGMKQSRQTNIEKLVTLLRQDADRDVGLLKEEVDKNATLRAELEVLRRRNAELEREVGKIKKERDHMAMLLKEEVANNAALSSESGILRERNEELSEVSKTREEERDKTAVLLKKGADDNKKLRAELDVSKKRIHELDSTAALLMEKTDNNKKLRAEADASKKQSGKMVEEIRKLQKEVADLKEYERIASHMWDEVEKLKKDREGTTG